MIFFLFLTTKSDQKPMESWSKKGQCSPAGTWPNSASQSWRWCWLSVWNLKSAAQTPNRTGDEIVVFFSLIFVFKEATTAVGGSRLCKNHCYMRCFCPVVLKSCFLQGLGLAGGWWSVRNCLFSKKPLQHWLLHHFAFFCAFLLMTAIKLCFQMAMFCLEFNPRLLALKAHGLHVDSGCLVLIHTSACGTWKQTGDFRHRTVLWACFLWGPFRNIMVSQKRSCPLCKGCWVCSGKEEQMTWPSPSPLQTSRNLRFRPVCEVSAADSTFETFLIFFIQVERLGTEVKSQDPQFCCFTILQKASCSNTFFLFFIEIKVFL